MKIRKNLVCICAVALLAGTGILSPLRAQSDYPRVQNRVLLIFDTSSAMKKRLPNEVKAINELFEITFNGKLHPGDSIGVWTFNRDLHMGQFPQLDWSDDKLNTLPPQLAAFLKKQRYTKDTSFDGLIQTLDEVVKTSPRLTTIIFCDGAGQVQGIPGAATINANFKGHHREMEKARMPFVIVLRSQFDRNQVGHYVGCTISSAQSITVPQFPPMPPPPAPPAPVQAPPPPPPPVAQPLIVIGTNAETNSAPIAPPQHQPAPPIPAIPAPVNPVPTLPPKPTASPAPAAPVPPAASPAPTVPIAETNSIPPPPAAAIEPTNAMVVPPQAPVGTPPPMAAQAVPPEKAATSTDGLIAAGAGIVIFAIAILFFILRRARGRQSASLITESLKKDKIHS